MNLKIKAINSNIGMKKISAIFLALFACTAVKAEVVAVTRDNVFGEIKLHDKKCSNRNGKFASRFNQAENTRWTGCWVQKGTSIFIYWDIPKNDPGNYPGSPIFDYPLHEFVNLK